MEMKQPRRKYKKENRAPAPRSDSNGHDRERDAHHDDTGALGKLQIPRYYSTPKPRLGKSFRSSRKPTPRLVGKGKSHQSADRYDPHEPKRYNNNASTTGFGNSRRDSLKRDSQSPSGRRPSRISTRLGKIIRESKERQDQFKKKVRVVPSMRSEYRGGRDSGHRAPSRKRNASGGSQEWSHGFAPKPRSRAEDPRANKRRPSATEHVATNSRMSKLDMTRRPFGAMHSSSSSRPISKILRNMERLGPRDGMMSFEKFNHKKTAEVTAGLNRLRAGPTRTRRAGIRL